MDDEYTVSENPVSTHSRLKAAGDPLRSHGRQYFSFNTQPPEGGWIGHRLACRTDGVVSTHSRLKAAGWIVERKLDGFTVSTHSRLKAAGAGAAVPLLMDTGFNTQPPEGGWNNHLSRTHTY